MADTPLGAQLRVVVTIPGLGLTTAGALLASLRTESAPDVTPAHGVGGLCPQERSSGPSIRYKSLLRVFAERLSARGERSKVASTAVTRKLLLLAWTLLRTGQPFSPTHAHAMQPTRS